MESKEKSITGSCKDLFPGVVKNWIEQLHCLFSFKMDFGCWVVLPLCCRMYKGRGMRSRVKMVRLCVLPDTLIREWRLLWVDQVYIFSCGKAWQLFEHFYSQPWWRLGAAREEGAVCSTFVHSSPADCTCSARHQQPAIEAFWKPPSVRSRSWENCGERERKLSHLSVGKILKVQGCFWALAKLKLGLNGG